MGKYYEVYFTPLDQSDCSYFCLLKLIIKKYAYNMYLSSQYIIMMVMLKFSQSYRGDISLNDLIK